MSDSLSPAQLVAEADTAQAALEEAQQRVDGLLITLAHAEAATESLAAPADEARAALRAAADSAYPTLPRRERVAAFRAAVASAQEAEDAITAVEDLADEITSAAMKRRREVMAPHEQADEASEVTESQASWAVADIDRAEQAGAVVEALEQALATARQAARAAEDARDALPIGIERSTDFRAAAGARPTPGLAGWAAIEIPGWAGIIEIRLNPTADDCEPGASLTIAPVTTEK